MDILFNKNSNGKEELKKTLGFLDGDFTYQNLEADIKLNTPYLIELISQEVYDKLVAYYKNTPNQVDEKIEEAIAYCQIYIASKAYLDFAPNNDLSHSNSGRSFRNEDNEKLAWDWQINNDNSATAKRAYKALDHLFVLLEKEEWAEWTNSEAYKTANSLFIKNTNAFDKAFPINKSGQLYYRLVSFMHDFEKEYVYPVITKATADTLKQVDEPSDDQQALLDFIHKGVAYLALGKALKAFPVEMFPSGLIYNENTRMKSAARAEVMQFLNKEGENYIIKLENEYQKQNQTFETINTTNGLDEGTGFVNL